MGMKRYLAYWRRGWWVWLLALCLNLTIVPLGFFAAAAFPGSPALYWTAFAVLWLVVGAPVWGWMFEAFARNSDRISDRLPAQEDV